MSSPVIMLVDGSNLTHAIYHALGGHEIADLMRTLRRRLSSLATMRPKPVHITVAFDSAGPSWRRDLYPEYKAQRGPKDAALVELLEAAADGLNNDYEVLTSPGVEADDLIATRWKHAREHDRRVVMVSADRDLWQLLRPDTTSQLMSFRTATGRVTDPKWTTYATFTAKYGFTPVQWPLFKAIAGDVSDNIPGICHLGELTATAICSKYATLEDAVADRWNLPLTPKQLTAFDNAVRDGSAATFVKLCTLDRDVAIGSEVYQHTAAAAEGMETHVEGSCTS